ncbi:MAG: Crp/Fnr family transcriptional regulator [Sphingobacterium sp.]
MHPLFNYINRYAPTIISAEDFNVIISFFIQKRIRKKQYLLQEGKICEYFAFILKGAVRQYYIDEKRVERVVNLYVENWWAGDHDSFVNCTPSIYNIDAWEDCEVLLISKENILKLSVAFPAFNGLLLLLVERNNIATQKRIISINFSAKKRYLYLVEHYPVFINRFPQHLIASYLGMTKDTLSRILKK